MAVSWKSPERGVARSWAPGLTDKMQPRSRRKPWCRRFSSADNALRSSDDGRVVLLVDAVTCDGNGEILSGSQGISSLFGVRMMIPRAADIVEREKKKRKRKEKKEQRQHGGWQPVAKSPCRTPVASRVARSGGWDYPKPLLAVSGWPDLEKNGGSWGSDTPSDSQRFGCQGANRHGNSRR